MYSMSCSVRVVGVTDERKSSNITSCSDPQTPVIDSRFDTNSLRFSVMVGKGFVLSVVLIIHLLHTLRVGQCNPLVYLSAILPIERVDSTPRDLFLRRD